MSDINIDFSRAMLSLLHAELRELGAKLPDGKPVNVWGKQAWAYHYGRDEWELHVTAGNKDGTNFYWHGSADNGFDARYKGWSAWAKAAGVDLDKEVAS